MEKTTDTGSPQGMAFSREQAHNVIDEFIALFNSDSFKQELKSLAPDEEKIVNLIDERQTAIFNRHGVDPKKGFADLRRIRQVYHTDVALIQKSVFAATREELVLNEALALFGTRNEAEHPFLLMLPFLGMQLPETSPKNVQQFQAAISNIPAAFALMQQRLAANPELLAQMSPAQQQQVQQMMMMQQQMRMMNMMGGMGPAQEINSDAALMNALLTPTINNNNGGAPNPNLNPNPMAMGMGPMGMGGMGAMGMGMPPGMGGMAPGRVTMSHTPTTPSPSSSSPSSTNNVSKKIDDDKNK